MPMALSCLLWQRCRSAVDTSCPGHFSSLSMNYAPACGPHSTGQRLSSCDTLLHLPLLLFTMVRFWHAKCTSCCRLGSGVRRCLLTDPQLQWLAGSLHTFGTQCTRQGNLDEAPSQQPDVRQDLLAVMALQTAQDALAAHVQMLVSKQEVSKQHDIKQVRGTAQERRS